MDTCLGWVKAYAVDYLGDYLHNNLIGRLAINVHLSSPSLLVDYDWLVSYTESL